MGKIKSFWNEKCRCTESNIQCLTINSQYFHLTRNLWATPSLVHPGVVTFICACVVFVSYLAPPSSPWPICVFHPKHSTAHPVGRPSTVWGKQSHWPVSFACRPDWRCGMDWWGLELVISDWHQVGMGTQWKGFEYWSQTYQTYLCQLLTHGLGWVFMLLNIRVNTNLTGLS